MSSYDSNEEKNEKKIGCLGWFTITMIIIGILLSLSGIGAVVGIPIAGFGGVGYLIYKVGLSSSRSIGYAIGCISVIIGIIVILFIIFASTGGFG
ncbi:MAG: hypothetical protein ACYDG2_14845 [Ruminiclostridium sp.]